MMRTFEELECWKKATVLRKQLSTLVSAFPAHEKFRLVDQIVRASRSVTANIAEGYGRYHYQEFVQFCRQSRGSLYELIDHLIVANDEGYITNVQLAQIKAVIDECLAVLNGFINYLKRAKTQNDTVNEPEVHYQLAGDDIFND